MVAPGVQTHETETLEGLLASLELRIGSARRVRLGAGDRLPETPGVSTLLYVAEGALHGAPTPQCALSEDRAAELSPLEHRATLAAGDASLTLDGRLSTAVAAEESVLVLATMELSASELRLRRILPDPIVLRGFDRIDPAAAALVRNMGPVETGECRLRAGEALLCTLMVRTVFLAVLRAWFLEGCAPRDWSARARDPQVERVLQAIHREPGRDWSLHALAELGAMSRSSVSRRFRELLGASPAHYVAEVRMEAAKRSLAVGMPVSQVSRELGYDSDEGFRRAFRRHAGVVPSQWRSAPPR